MGTWYLPTQHPKSYTWLTALEGHSLPSSALRTLITAPNDKTTMKTTARPNSLAACLCLAAALFASVTSVWGSALTTAVAPNERLCFYADVDKAGEKIGVRLSPSHHNASLNVVLTFSLVLFRCTSCTNTNIGNNLSIILTTPQTRSKQVDPLILTFLSWTPPAFLYWTANASVKATMSSPPTLSANIHSASRTTCLP